MPDAPFPHKAVPWAPPVVAPRMSPRECPYYQPTDGAYKLREATDEDRKRLSPPPGPGRRRLRDIWGRYMAFPTFAEKLHRKYGDTVTVRLPWVVLVVTRDADIGAEVRLEEGRLLSQGMASIPNPRLPTGSVQGLHGAEHRRRRNAFLKALWTTPYERIQVEEVLALQASWRPGRVFEMNRTMMELMSATQSAAVFGRHMTDDAEIVIRLRNAAKWELISNTMPGTRLIRRLGARATWNAERTFREYGELVRRCIADARSSPGPGQTVISGLAHLSGEDAVSDAEIRDDLTAAMGTSLGPTGFCATWAIWHLSQECEVRRRLEAEVDDVLGSRPIAPGDFDRLEYAQAVYREALRLHPPGYFIDKIALYDLVAGDFLIPKDAEVWVTKDFQRDSRFFRDAGSFRPERWLDGPARDSPPGHAYIPFGFGYRVCAAGDFGFRLAVAFLASTAQRWRLDPLKSKVAPAYGPAGPWRIKGGLKVRVAARR